MLLTLLLACSDPAPPAPPVEARAETAPERPDIVLVIVDTLRADHLGAMGHSRPTSPNLDALAARGAIFTRAYSQSGWTLASVSSLLTGLLPHEHLAVRDSVERDRYGLLSEETVTLAEALKAAGYATGAVVNNAFLAPVFQLDQGFDTYDWQGAWPDHHRGADATVSAGLAWLEAQQTPAFLMLHFMEPHMSYAPPDDLRGTFSPREGGPLPFPFVPSSEEAGRWMSGAYQPPDAVKTWMDQLYDEEILAVDRAVGALVRGLDGRARAKQTALIVTADHGEEHWDHGGFEHGSTLYGEVTRVPLIAAGAVPVKGPVSAVVQHLDLFQGLLALAGAPSPAGSRGANLWTLGQPGAPERAALSEGVLYGEDIVSIVDSRARLVLNLETGLAEAWAVDAQGGERERVPAQEREAVGARLLPMLQRLRADPSPLRVASSTLLEDKEAFEQLRALGYLDEGGAPRGDPQR